MVIMYLNYMGIIDDFDVVPFNLNIPYVQNIDEMDISVEVNIECPETQECIYAS